ncbi:MAG: iron-containing alcohol dehydrogenase [Clostridia bacterium]|nr:iron-containing alcohol dehydrogenase [Clostridia bacterium]
MDFNLSIPAKVLSGNGVVLKNTALFSSLGKRCLIVTGGKSAVLSGALDDVTAALTQEHITYSVFDRIGPNPLLSACHAAGTLAREEGAAFLIGIGGGSALDAAKAAAVYAANADFAPEDIYTKPRKSVLPFLLIGTTAGTGSEVGKVSVLTNDSTGRKKSISGDDLYPVLTFADPRYTASMPYAVTVSTALDALSHALEGYCSPKCGDIPSLFAEKAVALLWDGLTRLEATHALPDTNEREALYYGSLYAGITLAYCGTGFPHPLGYVLTENFGTPHGFACAAFLPEFMQRAAIYSPKRCEKILSAMGTDLDSFSKTVRALTELGDIYMTCEEVKTQCTRWDAAIPNNFKFSPGGFTKELAQELLLEMLTNIDNPTCL